MSFSSICLYVVFVLSENLIRQFASFKVYEILDNAIDEAQAGFASKIDVILLADNSVCITDNGRGVCALFSVTAEILYPWVNCELCSLQHYLQTVLRKSLCEHLNCNMLWNELSS